MSHPWMPFYVSDYLSDTMHLSTVEHGAYLLLIMHYWQHGCLPNDDAKLSRICRLSADTFLEVRDTLAGLFGEGWSHKRIDAELARTEDKRQKRAASGRKGGEAKASKQTDGNCLANASDLPQQKATNYNHSHKEEHPVSPSEIRPPQKSRGQFLPQDWKPCPEGQRMAIAEIGSRDAALRELEKFRNYWFAKSGADGRKRDWEATWRNWIMRAAENGQRNGNHQRQHRPASGHDNLLAAMDELLGGGDHGGGRPPGTAGAVDAERDAEGVYQFSH